MGDVLLFLFLQIFLESLPISSSGHMELLRNTGGFAWSGSLYDESLDYFSHLATVIVLLLFFFRDWWPLFRTLFFKRVWKDSYRALWKIALRIAWLTILAGIGTVALYVVIKVLLKGHPVLESNLTLCGGFLVTTVSLLSLKKCEKKKGEYYEPLNTKKALLLGFVQGLALLPGVSRFASTYVAARWMKISPRRALQASFLIQFFFILAGSTKGMLEIMHSPDAYLLTSPPVWLAILVGSCFALLGLHAVRMMTMGGRFWFFGVYEFIPALIASFFL
jgi:undecaprenyl-diphosphatase